MKVVKSLFKTLYNFPKDWKAVTIGFFLQLFVHGVGFNVYFFTTKRSMRLVFN